MATYFARSRNRDASHAQELRECKRLDQVIVRASIETTDPRIDAIACGDEIEWAWCVPNAAVPQRRKYRRAAVA